MTTTQQVELTFPILKRVSPEKLEFNPENPRFAGEIAGMSQDKIQGYLFGKAHRASELVDSFLVNGFIDYEPLVVKKKGKKFVVVEGNRRLAAINEIRANPEKYTGRKSDLDSIPVLIFPDHPDDQQKSEMRVYLGVRHLFGFREWPSISKARFLERASQATGGLDRVMKEVRIERQDVRRFLIPYRLLKLAGVALPPEEDFWVLAEALGRTGVQNFLQIDIDSKTLEIRYCNKQQFKHLLEYLYGPKRPGASKRDVSGKVIHDTRDVKRLARVLGSEKASQLLHRGKSLEEAEINVDTLPESLKRLQRTTKQLAVLLKKIGTSNRQKESAGLQNAFVQFESAVKSFLKKHA